jgi:putative SOS response-associated peptidase YedK
MCGRFTQAYAWAEIHAALSLLGAPPTNMPPRYNVSPADTVDVIVDRGAGRELVQMRWGIIPWFWKPDPNAHDKRFFWATFNARSEEVETKAPFKSAWKAKRRCVIPASGFYEWTGEKKNRQPLLHPLGRRPHRLCRPLGSLARPADRR